ncbi:MAG: ABC transporter ATP-binding protein [Clostridiales bacterium]|jgi:putative ABC transport system ATP-binding protein|nr:ABC transporter ATP-binding protein [Clostridiales bacterium]
MIELKNIAKRYNDFYALKNINLTVKQGEFFAIVGNSGSGKSTLLNMIGLIDEPTEGEVLYHGRSITSFSDTQKAVFRNKTIGFVFQAFHLEPSYSVFKNTELPLIIRGVDKRIRKKMVESALESVGLLSKIKNKADTLSGGEKQRVAIARALIGDPEIILADEPCGNLDTKNSEAVMKILSDINIGGKTVIMVTHNREHSAEIGRYIELADGEIVHDERYSGGQL